MKRIALEDRGVFEDFFRLMRWDSFYHCFPLIYALDKTVDRVRWEYDRTSLRSGCALPDIRTITIYVGDELLYPSFEVSGRKVWISLYRNPFYENELYDVNFIYDLEKGFPKSFRENAKRFERDHKPEWEVAKPKEAFEVVESWYAKRLADRIENEFHDFGYTLYLAKNFEKLNLEGRVVKVKGEPKAFSLWGKLNDRTAIHLIAKDLGIPYLQDYLRYKTYEEMKSKRFRYVNDGGTPTEGIRIYKLKLRPYLIYPIWSWVREC